MRKLHVWLIFLKHEHTKRSYYKSHFCHIWYLTNHRTDTKNLGIALFKFLKVNQELLQSLAITLLTEFVNQVLICCLLWGLNKAIVIQRKIRLVRHSRAIQVLLVLRNWASSRSFVHYWALDTLINLGVTFFFNEFSYDSWYKSVSFWNSLEKVVP